MKVTAYFAAVRLRPDRAVIRDEWIERAIHQPVQEHIQADGRIRRWILVPEAENRYGSYCWPMARRFTTHSLIDDTRHENPLLRGN